MSHIIGVTGGVGAGKSTVLATLKELCHAYVLMADDVAKELMSYGGPLCSEAIRLFGEEAYTSTHELNRSHIAKMIYEKPALLQEWNALVHPATNAQMYRLANQAVEEGYEFVFLEAALLIENHYDRFCEELWYIYASEEIRKERLMKERNYSEEKVLQIMSQQLSDEDFRKHCQFVINTEGDYEATRKQIENRLEQYR